MEERLAELQHQLDEVAPFIMSSFQGGFDCQILSLQTNKERDELFSRVSSQREAIHALQAELETSSKALTAAGSDASQLRSKVTHLQGLIDAGI